MKFRLLLSCCCLLSLAGMAQPVKRTGENLITVSAAGQYYFNKTYIRNDHMAPDPLSTRNTGGYSFGAGYQRITRHGWILLNDVQFGRMTHDIRYRYPLSLYDPETISLQGRFFEGRVVTRISYLEYRLLLGKRFRLRKEWMVDVLGGFGHKTYLNGKPDRRVGWATYANNAPNRYTMAQVFLYDNSLSDNERLHTTVLTTLANGNNTVEFYAGVSKSRSRGWLKQVSLGIEATHLMGFGPKTGSSFWMQSFFHNGPPYSFDEYLDKNLCIGLRIGAGFWK